MPDHSNKPVIFLAFANDRDDSVGYLRNLPEETRRLRDILAPAEQAGLCEVVTRTNCTADDIFKVFQSPKYRNRIAIFHYGGHANGYQLLLESAVGNAAAADAQALATFLGQQRGLKLVFLNGCSTQQQTQGLLDANVSAVISTSRAIDDQVATNLSSQFYQALAGGSGLDGAFVEAGAAARVSSGGETRALYFGEAQRQDQSYRDDRIPWDLYVRDGADAIRDWNLPDAVNNPLFGLPPLPRVDLPESPFRHLSWFTQKDSHVFFGRGHQIRALYDKLTAEHTEPIVLFYGQSGVGKSSILDAGLLPRLQRDHQIQYLRRDRERGLLQTLLSRFPNIQEGELSTAWWNHEQQSQKPLIIILDQVEEIFTRPNPKATPAEELDQLIRLAQMTFLGSRRPAGRLVLAFRKEWLAELEAKLIEAELPRTRMFLQPLDRRGVQEAILGPSRDQRLRDRYGLEVEQGLPAIISNDLLEDQDSAIAPTLQILLTKMWKLAVAENQNHPKFTLELYQKLKRDGILLRDFLDQQIDAFHRDFPDVVDSGLLIDLVAIHTTPMGTAGECGIQQLQEYYAHLGEVLPQVLQQCQDLHLLTVTAQANAESPSKTRLAHDTLAPLVRERFEESDKPGQRARRILDNRTVDWEDDNTGTPLDLADLSVVEEGVNGTRALSDTELRLLNASKQLRDRLHRNRRMLRMLGLLAILAIVAVAAVASWQRQEAVAAKQGLEESNEQLQEAQVKVEKEKSAAEEARDSAVEARTRSEIALRKAQRESYNQQLLHVADIFEKDPQEALALLNDEDICPVGLRDFTWRLYNSVCHREQMTIRDPSTQFQCVRYSPDGTSIVSANVDGDVQFWDAKSGTLQKTLAQHDKWIGSIDFNPSKPNALVSCSGDGTACVWDVSKGTVIQRLGGPGIYNGQAAFSADGKWLAIARIRDEQGENLFQVDLFDADTLKITRSFDTQDSAAWIRFNPSNQYLVVGRYNGVALAWNVDSPDTSPAPYDRSYELAYVNDDTSDESGQVYAVVSGFGEVQAFGRSIWHSELVEDIAFSPDGKILASACEDHSIQMSDSKTSFNLLGHTGPVTSVAFSPDGETLASAGRDGTIRTWKTQYVRAIAKQDTRHFASAMSPNGKFFALGDSRGNIEIRYADTGALLSTWVAHQGIAVYSLAFGAGGRLISVGGDSDIRIWNAANRRQVALLKGHTDEVMCVRLSPDGTRFATASEDGTVRIWNTTSQICEQVLRQENTISQNRSIAFGASGILATANGENVLLWNWKQGTLSRTLKGHTDRVMDVTFAEDGVTLASASADRTIRIWNIKDPDRPPDVLIGHDAVVSAIAFQGAGERSVLVSAALNGTMKIWDTVTRRQRTAIGSDFGGVNSLAFSSSGNRMVSSGDNGFQIWPAFEPKTRVESLARTTKSDKNRQNWQPPERATWEALPAHSGKTVNDGDVVADPSGMNLVAIPAGEFLMGSAHSPEWVASFWGEFPGQVLDQVPQHRVRITRRFLMGQFEVTYGQFAQFVEATGYKTDAERDRNWSGSLDPTSGYESGFMPGSTWRETSLLEEKDNVPVVAVSWFDANAYCRWLSQEHGSRYRLPTEAEWEYAARAGSTTQFFTGEDYQSLEGFANLPNDYVDWDDGFNTIAPVGQFRPNDFQLHDMHGNVWEWCQDTYLSTFYRSQASRQDNPLVEDQGAERVMRGGCFL